MTAYTHPNPALQAGLQRLNDLRGARNRDGILPQHEAAELSRLERELSAPLPRRAGPLSSTPFSATGAAIADDEPAGEAFESLPRRARDWTPVNFVGTVNGRSAKERSYRFGMWVLAKASADLPGRFSFPAAVDFVRDQFALHSGSSATGGASYVPEEFATDLVDLRERFGVVRRLFKRRPMASDTRTDPRRAGGLTAYFVGEGSAGTESTKSVNNVRLTARKLMVLSRYTNELSADAAISIGDDLAGEIAYAFASTEDDCGFNGDGTSTYGKITGVRAALNTAAGTPTTTSAGGIVIAAGNAYSEITLDNLFSMVGTLPDYADTPNTVWVCHRVFYASVMLDLLASQGGSSGSELRNGFNPPSFLGYPVVFSQKMPSTAANSQVCLLFGDFTLGASFGDRQADEISFSDSATVGGESCWERDQIAIRGTERFDINVHDVGNATTAGPIVGLQTLNS